MASGADLPAVPPSTSGEGSEAEEMTELETLKKEIKESKEAQDKMRETIEYLVETLKDIQNLSRGLGDVYKRQCGICIGTTRSSCRWNWW